MSIFRHFLSRSGSNIRGAPMDLETLSTVVHDEILAEYVEFPSPQTPPLGIVHPSKHQPNQHWNDDTERTQLSMHADPIPRPQMQIDSHPEKMLAHPIPSVRPTDINRYREPGYMGINPITLVGETGLLPGSWGQGKEFVNVMAGHEPRKWPGAREPLAYRYDTSMQQQKADPVIVDMNELRMQYAQAILDGGACAESSSKGSYLTIAMQSRKDTWAKGCDGVGGIEVEEEHEDDDHVDDENNDNDNDDDMADWEEVSGDEQDEIDSEYGSGHKRDDSGYSSGKAESASKTLRAGMPVVPLGERSASMQRQSTKKERLAS
ncbi:hypothetical protein EPUS_06258 [Endocarpon pusillum Z07020]|uniref:Uncharacterized protein n=1 Tax=Endocarpon pusillum (strain Z07020 / HMAS-L-300199) TaxID=1263415 RepID=U1HIT7_ENDPU|nr:uncharacterized protein EPUS_06258 [Endocarpon pusillum Z07020]ERF68814.1 hypothetical protein EPUS_06258 [Endocarpon pusillum Z07020]